jgi:hypothetical protein
MRQNQIQVLARMQHFKQSAPRADATIGTEMVDFFQNTVRQRQTKLTKIAECWVNLVPVSLNDHCALHSLNRGTLTVLVDSAPHLYELKQLLLAGLQDQLFMVCRSSGMRKIALKPGRPESVGERRCGGR